MLRSTALEIAIKILVTAEQEQRPRSWIPFIGKQHLLAVERKLMDVYAGQVALFRLTDLWIGGNRTDRIVHTDLMAGNELLVYPLERGQLQYDDLSQAGAAAALWTPPSSPA